MRAVLRREIQAYFLTPIGYVFMGVFLIISGTFFAMGNLAYRSTSVSGMLANITFMFMFVVPVLTMKLLSEERKNKSDQLLLTSPTSLFGIVAGKYLAAMSVFLLTLVVTLCYVVILSIYGKPSFGETVTGYIGFFLMGGCFISVGLFMSSVAENQVTAAVSTFAVLLFLWLADSLAPQINVSFLPFLPDVLSFVSLIRRYDEFAVGIMGISNIVFYLSFIALFLFLTVRVIEKRRWSEG